MKFITVIFCLVGVVASADSNVEIKPGQSVNIRAGDNTTVSCEGRITCSVSKMYYADKTTGYRLMVGDSDWADQNGSDFVSYDKAVAQMKKLRADGVCQ